MNYSLRKWWKRKSEKSPFLKTYLWKWNKNPPPPPPPPIQICTKSVLLLPGLIPHPSTEFQGTSCFCVILLTSQQTRGENITSLSEENICPLCSWSCSHQNKTLFSTKETAGMVFLSQKTTVSVDVSDHNHNVLQTLTKVVLFDWTQPTRL